MGYVHDTHICEIIPPSKMAFSAGTWTPTLAANVFSMKRTANDSAFTAFIPITPLQGEHGLMGAKLKSIDVFYAIATAAADDFATVELEKEHVEADGTIVSGAAVSAVTIDADHDTAAERKAQNEHVMTVTLDTPVYLEADDIYVLVLTVDCAANTVFDFYGARMNFDLRL